MQPVAIRHEHRWFDPSLTEGKSYYVWRLLTQFYNRMSVEYLPVVRPTPEEQNDPKLFAARVRGYSAGEVSVARNSQSFDKWAPVLATHLAVIR